MPKRHVSWQRCVPRILKYPVTESIFVTRAEISPRFKEYLSFFKKNSRIPKLSQHTGDNVHSLDKINDTVLISLFSNKGLLRKRQKNFIVKKKIS
jgi:hypothetical protein